VGSNPLISIFCSFIKFLFLLNFSYLIKNFLNFCFFNPFTFILFFTILFSILIFISANPVLSLIYFNLHVLLNAILLCLFDMSFYGIIFIVVYIGAITIFFIFLIMLIDVRSLRNFTVQYDNILNFCFFGFLLFLFFVIAFFGIDFSMELGQLNNYSLVNGDFYNFQNDSVLQLVGLFFTFDFFIIILVCFLLLVCIIIIMIGFKDSEDADI
jgi:NADH:ubiquinone oxidoreductase subunit 6 (subunit J)